MLDFVSYVWLLESGVMKNLPENIGFGPIKLMRGCLVISVNRDVVLVILLLHFLSMFPQGLYQVSLLKAGRLLSRPLCQLFPRHRLEFAEGLLHRLWAHTLLLPILILLDEELLLQLELHQYFLLVHFL